MCCISNIFLTFDFSWNRCIRQKFVRGTLKTDHVYSQSVSWGRSTTLAHDWSDQPPINVKELLYWSSLEESMCVIGRLIHRS